MEFHPRVKITDLPLSENKIILGSFPTWSLSAPDSYEKKKLRDSKGDNLFFFGSSGNNFWLWYEKFVDPTISKGKIKSIQKSLNENKIGITDVILACKRKGVSSLDKHLANRMYNHSFFEYPEHNETLKILCTSKGVLNEMLLNKDFFRQHNSLELNSLESEEFQDNFMSKINGNLPSKRHSIYKRLKSKSGGKIECLAIPSPGSPYRKLTEFGCLNGDAKSYLHLYLKNAFEWFIE